MTCEKHGEYEAKVIIMPNLDREHVMPCPECGRERQEEEERREEEERKRQRAWEIEAFISRCGAPLRFRDKTLEALILKGQRQEATGRAVRNYLSALKKGEGPSLIMCGKPGTGKTHIGCALVKSMCGERVRSEYTTTTRLMRAVKSTYSKASDKTEEEVIRHYARDLGFLVIDEVGVQFGTETEKLIFYEVVNGRYENMLPTVLISNLTADELKAFIGERAFDRFREDGGAILAFDWESYRDRATTERVSSKEIH